MVGRSRSLGLTDDELELVFASGCLPSTFLVEVASSRMRLLQPMAQSSAHDDYLLEI